MAEAKVKSVAVLLILIVNFITVFHRLSVLWIAEIPEGMRFVRLLCSPALLYGTTGIYLLAIPCSSPAR